MLVAGLVNWLYTQEPNITYNAGLVRPIKVNVAREGAPFLDPKPGTSYQHQLCNLARGLSSTM